MWSGEATVKNPHTKLMISRIRSMKEYIAIRVYFYGVKSNRYHNDAKTLQLCNKLILLDTKSLQSIIESMKL